MLTNITLYTYRTELIKGIRNKVKPLLHKSGFVRRKEQKDKVRDYDKEDYLLLCTLKKPMILPYFGEVVYGFTYSSVIVDMYGGGLVTVDYKDLSIESLLTIYNSDIKRLIKC